jgi:uncharacterized protein (DUF885 family)
MGCEGSADKKSEKQYEELAHAANNQAAGAKAEAAAAVTQAQAAAAPAQSTAPANQTLREIKAPKEEKKALSAETEHQLFEIYGVGVTVVAQCMLHVMRGEIEKGKQLVACAGARTVYAQNDRKRDVDPAMLSGVVELLCLEEKINKMRADKADLITIEDTIRMATCSWLLGHAFEGHKIPTPRTAKQLFERYTIEKYFDDPEGLTELGVLEQCGLTGHNRHLTARPTAMYHQLHASLSTATLGALEELLARGNILQIMEEDRVSLEVLRTTLLREIEFHSNWHSHAYAIDQANGCHVKLLMLLTELTPVRNIEDLANYMIRVSGLPKKLKMVMASLREQVKNGIVPPAFLLENVACTAGKIATELTQSPDTHPLFVSAFQKLERSGFTFPSAEDKETSTVYMRHSLEKAAEGYKQLHDDVTNMLHMHTNPKCCVSNKDYYHWCLREHTSMPANEIHHAGHDKVAEVEGFINSTIDRLRVEGKLPAEVCLEDKTIGDHLRGLSCHSLFNYPNSVDGQRMLVADYATLVLAARQRISGLFAPLPQSRNVSVPELNRDFGEQPLNPNAMSTHSAGVCQVTQTPEHYPVEPQISAFYAPQSLDHSRAATLFVNPNTAQVPKWIMRTVAAHETYPGRHLQAVVGQDNAHLPMWRKSCHNYPAFEEGWAMYASKLAREVDFFKTETDASEGFDLLGYLTTMQLQAARAVVDTGIHEYGWTKDEASNYLTAHSSLFPEAVACEVERLCVAPGQAVTHLIGDRKFSELRQLVREHLEGKGVEFNVAQFHTVVLSGGAMSLAQLESRVKHHYQIEQSQAAEVVVPEVNLPHVVVQGKVDHEREHLRRPLPDEVAALHAEYSELHHALRENGLMGQRNDGRQYMDYVMRFVEKGITHPDQLKGVSPAILQEIGLTTQERRLYQLVFK